MKRFVVLFVGAAGLLLGLLVWWFKIDGGPPTVRLDDESGLVGRDAAWVITIESPGRSGISRVEIRLAAAGRTFPLAERDFEARGWLGSGVDALRIPLEVDLARLGVPEGPATLEVLADTHGWRLFDRPTPIVGSFPQRVDRTPPTAQVLSDQHNLRLGGSGAVVVRLGDDARSAEVLVGPYSFPVMRDFFADPSLGLSIFAVPEDLDAAAQPVLRVFDPVGNRVDVPIYSTVRPREFRDRTLEIDDDFLRRKIPPIFAAHGMAAPDDLLEGYLVVNRDIRKSSEEKLRQVTSQSETRPLWQGAFGRMARAQTMSEFGDRRSYFYGGRVVDRQTHLGVDLASLRGAAVDASQDGKVVFTGDLGIYGQTVVLDHGLGVFTLYGHLSSIAVADGESVTAGQAIGTTGQTGLAGGDHLHFSIMVRGVHVDPVEWWDPKWVRDHVAVKLDMFPRAGEAEGAAAPEATAGAAEGGGAAADEPDRDGDGEKDS